MSEYIIDMGNSSYKSSSGLLCADVSQLREEVVRCRDCKRMRGWTAEESDGYGEAELADGWCMFFRIGTYDDFFCAWGTKTEFVTCKCGEDIERIGRIQTCPSCGRVVYA